MARDTTKSPHTTSNSNKHRIRQLDAFQKIIKIKFKNRTILNRALTHRSFVNESGQELADNERLEYLGDSVLALIVNEYLFRQFEHYQEGSLAKIKSAVVSESTLSRVAQRVNLGNFILMGRGEEQSGGRERPSILANTLEAVIGSIYLDSGLKQCRVFVLKLLKQEIETIDSQSYLRDPKTTLQEYVQKIYKERPVYQVVEERGPDHKKEFVVRLMIQGAAVTIGVGSSKRKAEMEAAASALKQIEDEGIEI
ncbi:MAG: ribonuclease III [Spirochaetes bacterium]|nr:ribonuclease III [Spirochaetota bacterium]